jgi:hypothetical protein
VGRSTTSSPPVVIAPDQRDFKTCLARNVGDA